MLTNRQTVFEGLKDIFLKKKKRRRPKNSLAGAACGDMIMKSSVQ